MAWVDWVGSGVGHIGSGAIETRPGWCDRRRNEELVMSEAFHNEHRLSTVWTACWLGGSNRLLRRCCHAEQEAATQQRRGALAVLEEAEVPDADQVLRL
jgi:hypothetical protein